jgi:hypothetical protein
MKDRLQRMIQNRDIRVNVIHEFPRVDVEKGVPELISPSICFLRRIIET